jgi:hypothetical protein
MMMNQFPAPRDQIPRPAKLPIDPVQLSYDFTEDDLYPEPLSLEKAPELSLFELLTEVLDPDYVRHDPDAAYRTMNMALALFTKLCDDSAYDGIYYNDLFALCLDTALTWEVG